MRYTSRQDFPPIFPSTKTQYCWQCKTPGAVKIGTDPVTYDCQACGRQSERVLIFDPNMQMHFDDKARLVHESCGVFVTRADGKLLLFKRTKFPYLLTIPAGHMEIGEAADDCARRETEEEVGISPGTLTRAYTGDIVGDSCLGGADIHHWHAYACLAEAAAEIRLDAEGSAWNWYDIGELTAENTVQPVMFLLQDSAVRGALEAVATSD
jgi:ADP-ribose pyrophosphatase YjhB (NUDIX family)